MSAHFKLTTASELARIAGQSRVSIARRARSRLINVALAALNGAQRIHYRDARHPIGWRDRIGLWLETRLGAVFWWLWCGSEEEIHPHTLELVPPRHMTPRQRAAISELAAEPQAHCSNCNWRGRWTPDIGDDCIICGEVIYLDLSTEYAKP